jgi:beta-galactosidase
MAHILPHWNWPERMGEITPVHVFTSGDEAELFLNNRSLGRKKKGACAYRLRWDSVKYEPGILKVIAYRDGRAWAENAIQTTGEPFSLVATADRNEIIADGKDLSFVTIQVSDKEGLLVPRANHTIQFSMEGPGEMIATDNGDPSSLVSFGSPEREAFNGLALVVVRSLNGEKGTIKVTATSEGLVESAVEIKSK